MVERETKPKALGVGGGEEKGGFVWGVDATSPLPPHHTVRLFLFCCLPKKKTPNPHTPPPPTPETPLDALLAEMR